MSLGILWLWLIPPLVIGLLFAIRGADSLSRFVGFVVLACLVGLLLTGCTTTPEWQDQPQVACEPLPTCEAFIPPNADSTQLELGLWACVLEYRAQYSSCANRSVP